MNIKTELFLTWRYLKPKRNAVSVITCISIVGVTLGVAVLVVVLAVMTGFTNLIKEKLFESTSHIQLSDRYKGYIPNPNKVIKEIKEKGMTGAPITYTPVFLQKGEAIFHRIALGADPSNTGRFDLKKHIQYGQYSLEKGQIILSTDIARRLNAYVGDKILVHSPEKLTKLVNIKDGGGVELNKNADVYLPEEFKVAGIYNLGEYDFNSRFVFMGIDEADDLLGIPWGACSAVYVWVKNPFDLKKEADWLNEKYPTFSVYTWQQLNRQFVGVLAVEKNMMFFLLIFIVLVAASSIMNTLITVVIQKTREIGLLKALGATSGGVMRIFIFQGFFVGFFGTLLGIALGTTVVFYRNWILKKASLVFGIELFPREFYHFDELPAQIVGNDLLLIAIITLVLCTISAVIPAWRAARQDPAKALRYE